MRRFFLDYADTAAEPGDPLEGQTADYTVMDDGIRFAESDNLSTWIRPARSGQLPQLPVQPMPAAENVMEGFWSDLIGGARKVGGYVYGAIGAARNMFGSAQAHGVDGSKWQRAMEAARTVQDQLLVFEGFVRDVQGRAGRALTPAERQALEQQIFGPGGAPNGLPGSSPAVSPGAELASLLVPVALAGALYMTGRRGLLPVAAAAAVWWYMDKQKRGS